MYLPHKPFNLKFDSKDAFVKIPHSDALNLESGSNLTTMAWINLEQRSTGYIIVKKQSFALAMKKQSLMFSLHNTKPGWVWKNTKNEIPLKKWVHVALTYSGESNNATIYIDALPIKEFDKLEGPIKATTNDLYFGLNLVESFLFGMIRDCRIFKRALTIHEIKESMTTAPNVDTDVDLLGWWPMDNGYGTEIVDLSTYGLHGEINAAQWVRDNSGDFIQSTLGKDLNSMFNNKIGSDIR
eukprot:TRINITY_DN5727_c0_g2_i5.p1 TRINITY_DN5727_c0_g2~~TRINITY_DN5727_c0_g2_i5.p1  ORF type:complete len:262 (-),score=43.84 TRINITY_DN5727_c0_g2_i5:302-1021(-)